ncbi:MAG: hypothetical protein QW116_04680 [Zestosphaera sp.]
MENHAWLDGMLTPLSTLKGETPLSEGLVAFPSCGGFGLKPGLRHATLVSPSTSIMELL